MNNAVIHDLALVAIGFASGGLIAWRVAKLARDEWREHCRTLRILWRMLQDDRVKSDALAVLDTYAKQAEK